MKSLKIVLIIMTIAIELVYSQSPEYTWRYYNTGNTGIQGDYVEAVWIDHDGNPYIAGYNPGFEEGGFAKFIQSENRWINYSNIDYPVIGNINDVGASRISDIVESENGILWMAHWRGLLKFDPRVGGSSLEFFGANNSPHPGGRSREIAIAPDGSLWMAVIAVNWGSGGLVNYNPSTNVWRYWGYGSNANNWPNTVASCDNVSIQEIQGGGYTVWISASGNVISFESNTQMFTKHTFNYNPGELVKTPGHNCVDEQNNLWMIRFNSTAPFYFLEYKTQSGQWQTPPQPVSSVLNDIWAFKAYGNGKALLIDGNSELWQYNGTTWQSLGIWRQGGFSYGIEIDEAGNIWVTGIGGAAKRDAQTGSWQRYRITNTSQFTYWVEDITIDNSGNVYMAGNAGTGVGGFQKFDGTRWIGHNEFTYGLGNPFPFPTDNAEVIYFRPSNNQIIVNPMFNNLHSWNGNNYTSLNYSNDRSEGVVEDSQNRLWSLGEYYNLKYYSNNTWTSVPFDGWGYKIAKDPTRPGTIWASSGFQVLRTDGNYSFTRYNTNFPELNPQSDLLTTVAADVNGVAWVGSNQGLFKINAETGTYQFYSPSNSQIPGDNISPLAVTPDGRIWFANFQSTTTSTYGLCWFDGTDFGIIPQQQTGGLPHAQIYDLEVKILQDGYELWISCASRGVAVLTVNNLPANIVNLTTFIEGFYNPSSNSQISDTIKVYLRNAVSPYLLKDSTSVIMQTNGNSNMSFIGIQPGQYYIIVKHRNSIETWSRSGGENIIPGSTLNYNISDQITKAFGKNLKQVDSAPVRFALFSGDVNQDGVVDGTDLGLIDNDALNSATGYINTDINGDQVIDISDFAIVDNNAFNFVSRVTP